MPVGVLEEGHPKIVVVHLGDQVRAKGEDDAALLELGHGQCDISATEVDAALGYEKVIGLRKLYR
jgi:hypothetical protein